MLVVPGDKKVRLGCPGGRQNGSVLWGQPFIQGLAYQADGRFGNPFYFEEEFFQDPKGFRPL